jgi:hypothetical protein
MKKIKLLLLVSLTLSVTTMFSQSVNTFFNEASTFFKTYVSNGSVNYKAIHDNPELLDQLLENAKSINIVVSDKNTYKAFWINAYNLSVIKGVIDNYPIKSPLDINGFFDVKTYALAGSLITLNDIENKMLRAKFDEPRFHFVLVCGANGCPPLVSEAYIPSKLDSQLQRQTVKALNNNAFIKVNDGEVGLSEIFKWYKEDFTKKSKNLIEFVNIYRKEKIPTSYNVSYYNYDWQLNSI